MPKDKKPRKPFDKAHGRDYSREREYQSTPEQKENRAARGRARYEMIKKGKAKVGDNKDVAHEKPLSEGGSNKPTNLKVESPSKNRARVSKKTGKHR
jgi:hypothetical protein